MSENLTPLPQDSVVSTAQVGIAYFDDPRNTTPNNMVEGIAGLKSLLRGIQSGQLLICQVSAPPAAPPPKKQSKKKAA